MCILINKCYNTLIHLCSFIRDTMLLIQIIDLKNEPMFHVMCVQLQVLSVCVRREESVSLCRSLLTDGSGCER